MEPHGGEFVRFFRAQAVKELVCHTEELGFYTEVYGQRVLFREVAQFDLVTYKKYSLIGYIDSKGDRLAYME